MATYITLRGVTIPVLASDPSNLVTGDIWFNSTSGTIKGYNGSSTVTFTAS
jgi:hypothetical protein